MLQKLTVLGALAIALVACSHKQPQTQVFRRDGWKGYMGLPSTGLEYRGKIEIRGDRRDSLLVEVNALNPTTDSVTVQISQCGGARPNFSVRIYGPRRGLLRKRGHPAWTLDAWRQAQSKPAPRQSINGLDQVTLPICVGVSYAYRFAAGGSRSLGNRSIALRDVLGDSLPPGRYLVSALIEGFSFGYVTEARIGEVEWRQPAR